MEIEVVPDVRLSPHEVHELLVDFDKDFNPSLSSTLDFDVYSQKLSQYGYFVMAYEGSKIVGFISYYLNLEGRFVYIPFIAVKSDGYQRKGIGQMMLICLERNCQDYYRSIRLEVLKSNVQARSFYQTRGFVIIEDRQERLLLSLNIDSCL
jgi:ribosomal protein S18 acetylase RimI-like enzyme